MVMKCVLICFQGTIQKYTIKMEENQNYFAGREKRLSYEHRGGTLCLFGENSKMILDSKESTAPSSEMNQNTNQVSLSDRLMQSLISVGLVKGIIPMSMRVKSNQLMLDTVLRSQDGNLVDLQK